MNLRDNASDSRDLERAVELLCATPVLIRFSNAVGSSIEAGIKKLPAKVKDGIQAATEKGLTQSIALAERTLGSEKQEAWTASHTLVAAASGAIGGFFGFTGLLVEIPVTTTVIMRSILDIARSEGHRIADRQIQLECLSVFSHGSKQQEDDDDTEIAYYVGRAAMAELISETAKALGKVAADNIAKGVSASSAGKWLAQLIHAIAVRYGIVVTEKAVLQAAPVIGAVTGATINGLFMDFYQDVARGHFIVLRLETIYGEDIVRQEFERIRKVQRSLAT
ncbi:EcsC family protein [Pseudoduganella lutea]|uniref:EcsC family protein n=1 Tax=Pseudoduganella lutea TaxID=321985 RepID=A0A4P6KZD8_9BURK|nr:EcsC family protein [Pseudoduganella lutea]QBE64337.1 EcsC family protein [Pseudoduganella lutea]